MAAADQIQELVRKDGPVLPVEIASKTGLNSMVVAAYLEELVQKGTIKSTSESVGGSKMYFVPGQEAKIKTKMSGLNKEASKTARMYQGTTIVKETPELLKKREEFLQYLTESIKRDEELKKKKAPKSETKQVPLKIELPPEKEGIKIEEEPKEEEKPVSISSFAKKLAGKVSKPKPKKEKTPKAKKPIEPKGVVLDGIRFLQESGFEIDSYEIEKGGKEATVIATMPTKMGFMKIFVKIKSKKSINDGDLSLAYSEGINKNLPVFYMTNGKLTKKAEKYLETVAGLLKVKKL